MPTAPNLAKISLAGTLPDADAVVDAMRENLAPRGPGYGKPPSCWGYSGRFRPCNPNTTGVCASGSELLRASGL